METEQRTIIEPGATIYPFQNKKSLLTVGLEAMFSEQDEGGYTEKAKATVLEEKVTFMGVDGRVLLQTRPNLELANQHTPFGPVRTVIDNNNGRIRVINIPLYLALGFDIQTAEQVETLRLFNINFDLNGDPYFFNFHGHNNPTLGEDAERSAKRRRSQKAELFGDILYKVEGPRDLNKHKPLLPYSITMAKSIGLTFKS